MVTMPWGEIRINEFGTRLGAAGGAWGSAAFALSAGCIYADMSKPPPTVAVTRRNERRLIVLAVLVSIASMVIIGTPSL
jgi:hypothetical protein